jgi:hypothetical protein
MRSHPRCPTLLVRRVALLALLLIGASPAPAALAETAPPGDIPDNQAFVTARGTGFSVQVPEGWSRATRAGSTTFVDTYSAITVRIERRMTAPTVATVSRSELAQLKAATKGFAHPRLEPVNRPAGSGVLVRYEAASPPSSVTGKRISDDVERYELWRAGRLAIVTLEAPRGSDNVDAWKRVTRSFRWAG